MRKSFAAPIILALRQLGAAMLFSAAFAAASAGAHAADRQPLVSVDWLKAHLGDGDLVVLDIRSAIDGGGTQAACTATTTRPAGA